MINYTNEELQNALKDFDDNLMRYENLNIESAYIAIDCIRYCIIDKRKTAKNDIDFNEPLEKELQILKKEL